jgi:hypothetical protein
MYYPSRWDPRFQSRMDLMACSGIPLTIYGIIESSCGPPNRTLNLTSAVSENGARG